MNPINPPASTGPAQRLEAFPPSAAAFDWREVCDALGEAIFVHAAGDGRILGVNAAACQMYGYDAETLGRCTLDELSEGVPPYSGDDARRWMARAATDGPQVFEWRARTAAGRIFWAEVVLTADRASGRCLAAVRDLSARKALAAERERAAEALRQSEERLRLLLGRMPSVAVQGCAPDGTVRYWNEASERLYGYTAAEALGRNLALLIVPPPLRDETRILWHQILATSQALPPAECQLQRKDGSLVSVVSSHMVIGVPGATPELYRIDVDLSERKQAEAERLDLERRLLHSQKLESLGVLAGGVAHDFNNLLTGVLGNIELARSDLPAGDPRAPLLDDAIGAARLAASLTHQMLAYVGHTPFPVRSLDLNAIVREQEPLLHAAVAGRAQLQLALAPDLPEIDADSGQIGQILVNLVTNAAESIHAPPGTVELRTGRVDHASEELLAASLITEKPQPQAFVLLEIADTGCGMDTVIAQRVFDPFYSTKFAGRGLGLPVVQSIVRAHHGALFIDSRRGLGTVVTVLLPLARTTAQPVVGPAGASAPQPHRVLLVVDDDEAVRRLALRMGRRLGFEVVTAADGEAAVELCRHHAGGLHGAIVDLTMPGMDGFECLRALHEVRPDLPALLVSGCSEAEIAERHQPAAFAGFLQKPFSIEQFTAALRHLGPLPAAKS